MITNWEEIAIAVEDAYISGRSASALMNPLGRLLNIAANEVPIAEYRDGAKKMLSASLYQRARKIQELAVQPAA